MSFIIDLYCGLGGWAEGFLSENWRVIGFDIERRPYPGQLVIQDVLTLHGSQFRNAAGIVASPPCQAYSYRAMPWKRAKALPSPDNTLFDACFRIQRQACEAAGRYIPMVVENVVGAQRWVGRARWHYGSFYLWGDVPALMPSSAHLKGFGGTWFGVQSNGKEYRQDEQNPQHVLSRQGFADAARYGLKVGDKNTFRANRKPSGHFTDPSERIPGSQASTAADRKAASALIAKIPFPLAKHIARCWKAP